LDALKHEIEEIEGQTAERGKLEGFAQAAQQKANAIDNFTTGALKDAKDALEAAQTAYDASVTAGEDNATKGPKEKALEEAKKKAARADSELQQLTEDAERAASQLEREDEMTEVISKVDEAKGQEAYFRDVIHYFNEKLHFFEKVEEALEKKQLENQEGEDWMFYQSIQPEKSLLWDMLYDLNNQLVDIQYQISDLEYNEFALKNRFAAEDESAAQEDLDRQRAWFEEAGADLTALKAEQDALKDAAGTISDQTEYDRLGGLMQGLQQEKDELEGALQEFTDELQRKRDEQEANENARREAAEQEEKERALEAEGRAAQDRQRERERAEQDLQNMHRYIQEWHNEQDDIYRKLNETTDARKYQEYDAALRELAQRIEEEHDYIRDVEAYLQQLDQADQDHQRYLDDVQAQEMQQTLEAAQGRIDGLQGEREAFQQRQGEAQAAKRLYEQYNPAAAADRPSDWTEELALGYEEAFYDLEREVKELERNVEETQKMKEEVDRVLQEQRDQAQEKFNDINGEWERIKDDYFNAKAVFEENRLYTGTDPEYLNELRDAIMNAERAYWDAQPIIYEFRAEQERAKAASEDMKAVFDAREGKEGDAENELQQYKTPLDDAKSLAASEKVTLETY
jgi:chromosome segregation ATPase